MTIEDEDEDEDHVTPRLGKQKLQGSRLQNPSLEWHLV